MVNTNANPDDLERRLYFADNDALNTCKTARSYLKGSSFTHIWMWMQMEAGVIPAWAENHIKATNKLEEVVSLYQKEGLEIPEDVITSLKECRDVVNAISNKVDQIGFNELVKINRETIKGSEGLLSGKRRTAEIPKSSFEWQLNLGLMMNAYHRAKTPELKKEISFLILNYLAKAAPISFSRLEAVLENQAGIRELKEMFQLGYFVDHGYHRERNVFTDLFGTLMMKEYSSTLSNEILFTLDTIDIDHLFPIKFIPIPLSEEAGSSQMVQVLLEHFKENPDLESEKTLSKGMLLDLTPVLSQFILTQGSKEKEIDFNLKLESVRTLMDGMIKKTIHELKIANFELLKTLEDEAKMIEFIKTNTLAVCRNTIKDVGVITSVPVFKFSLFNIEDFINLTGLRMGGVSSRMNINNFISLDQLVARSDFQMAEYSVPGSQETIYFPDLKVITQTKLFRNFETKMDRAYQTDQNSPIAILGKSTAQLIKGLLSEISQERWDALNKDPVNLEGSARSDHLAKRILLQSSMYRLTQHLAKAENNAGDFTKFTEAIELAHCEIATLLQLTAPFDPANFQNIYKQQLGFVPEEFQKNVSVGITKSAMNTFAGICSAVISTTRDPQIAHGEDSYFEEIYVVGPNRSIMDVLSNPQVPKVDLYVGEFNHNINIHEGYHHYKAGDVIGDVEKLLKEKPSEQLTVAIDSTIDLVASPKAKALMIHFSKEIREGKLNLVFFRSGQKFEMLGMDNYYGSPFYMVNNGGPQWNAFNALKTQESFKTDPLSTQWFCLVNKYAPQQLDDYRATVIKNSKDLLKRVPAELRDSRSPVRVSTVDPDMAPAFIDLKIVDQTKIDKNTIEQIFYNKMIEKGRKVHSRGSFGFYHPNFNFIDMVTLRINPGLDPKDNEIIEEVLKELVKEMQK
jgi:hypothetical protein